MGGCGPRQLLSLACASSEACALHVSQERKWRAQLGAIMPKASPHAEKERRRERARAGRARLMASMQQKQQAFAGEEAPDEAAEAAGTLTPGSRARAERREAEAAALHELLGSDETNCVLCKEALTRADANGDAPRCGLFARARRQRLPRAGGASRRLSAFSKALADDGGLSRGRWRRRWKGSMPTLMGRPPATRDGRRCAIPCRRRPTDPAAARRSGGVGRRTKVRVCRCLTPTTTRRRASSMRRRRRRRRRWRRR